MNKVLIINQLISEYRIDIYEMLAKHHNLTIAHCGKKVNSNLFKQILLKNKKVGPFSILKTKNPFNNIFDLEIRFGIGYWCFCILQ